MTITLKVNTLERKTLVIFRLGLCKSTSKNYEFYALQFKNFRLLENWVNFSLGLQNVLGSINL